MWKCVSVSACAPRFASLWWTTDRVRGFNSSNIRIAIQSLSYGLAMNGCDIKVLMECTLPCAAWIQMIQAFQLLKHSNDWNRQTIETDNSYNSISACRWRHILWKYYFREIQKNEIGYALSKYKPSSTWYKLFRQLLYSFIVESNASRQTD